MEGARLVAGQLTVEIIHIAGLGHAQRVGSVGLVHPTVFHAGVLRRRG